MVGIFGIFDSSSFQMSCFCSFGTFYNMISAESTNIIHIRKIYNSVSNGM